MTQIWEVKWKSPLLFSGFLGFLFAFYSTFLFQVFRRISYAGEVHVYKQRKKVKFLHTDISS